MSCKIILQKNFLCFLFNYLGNPISVSLLFSFPKDLPFPFLLGSSPCLPSPHQNLSNSLDVPKTETQLFRYIFFIFQVLYCETPCNPTMILADLEEFGKLGKSLGIITMADSTFASPFNQNPIKHGIDVVIHSW